LPIWILAVATTILALLLGLPIAATLVLAAGNTFSPFNIAVKWRLRHLGFAVAAGVLFHSMLLSQVQTHADALAARIEADGPMAINTLECLGIYVFGGALGGGAFLAGYPDAAREHLGLYRQGPAVRVQRSDFPMQSAKVEAALHSLAGTAAATGKPQQLAKRFTFQAGADPAALALALDPLALTARATPARDGVHIEAAAEVPVAYTKLARTKLFTAEGTAFYADESLFWALQERGWLHPYRESYVWRYTLPRQP
jgi:hypothetical protein